MLYYVNKTIKLQEIEENSRLFQHLIRILTDRSSITWTTVCNPDILLQNLPNAVLYQQNNQNLGEIEEYSRFHVFQYLIHHHVLTDRSSITCLVCQQNNQHLGDRRLFQYLIHSSSYFDGSILNNMEYFRGLFCLAFSLDFFGFVHDHNIVILFIACIASTRTMRIRLQVH